MPGLIRGLGLDIMPGLGLMRGLAIMPGLGLVRMPGLAIIPGLGLMRMPGLAIIPGLAMVPGLAIMPGLGLARRVPMPIGLGLGDAGASMAASPDVAAPPEDPLFVAFLVFLGWAGVSPIALSITKAPGRITRAITVASFIMTSSPPRLSSRELQ